MVPLQAVCCPLAAIGISGLYAAWNRLRQKQELSTQEKRERIAYMLWIAATRV